MWKSTKGGFESILEIVLTLPPHCKYAYIHVNPCWCVYVSKLSSCMVRSAYQQTALHWFFMLSVHDTSPSCSLQHDQKAKVLGLSSWRLSKQVWLQSRLLFTQLLCLTWKYPNISFRVLHTAVRSEMSVVSEATNPNKDKPRERESFRAGALFALYLHSGYCSGHLFHGWAYSILKTQAVITDTVHNGITISEKSLLYQQWFNCIQ